VASRAVHVTAGYQAHTRAPSRMIESHGSTSNAAGFALIDSSANRKVIFRSSRNWDLCRVVA
jgi:hypothetical protein